MIPHDWRGGQRGCIKTGGWFACGNEYWYGDLHHAESIFVFRLAQGDHAVLFSRPSHLHGRLSPPVLEFSDHYRTTIHTRVELFSYEGLPRD